MGRKLRGRVESAEPDAEGAAEGVSFPILSHVERDTQREREGRVARACLARQLVALRVETLSPDARAMDAFFEVFRAVEAVVGPIPRLDAVERADAEPLGFPLPLRRTRGSGQPAAAAGWLDAGGNVSAHDVRRMRALLQEATEASERRGHHTPVLRPHHVQGVAWLMKLYESGSAAILNDERGAGKAVQVRWRSAVARAARLTGPLPRTQVACMLAMVDRVKSARGFHLHPHLVVTTAAHVSLWDRELVRWAPELVVHVASHAPSLPRAADVVVLCADDDRHMHALCAREWDVLVVDNTAEAVYRPAEMTCLPRGLRCQFRVLMGAGLPFRLPPLCRLLSLVHPALSPLAANFAACCAASKDGVAARAVAVLRASLLPLVLARPAAVVRADSLVALTARCEHSLHVVVLGQAQREAYSRAGAAEDCEAGGSPDRSRLVAAAAALRAAALHPQLLSGEEEEEGEEAQGNVPAAKIEALLSLLRRDRREGLKSVVFCQVRAAPKPRLMGGRGPTSRCSYLCPAGWQAADAVELVSRELARASVQHVTLGLGRGAEAASRFNDADPLQAAADCVAVVDLRCVGVRPLCASQGAHSPPVALYSADTATFVDGVGDLGAKAAAATAVTAARPLAWGPVRVRCLVAADSVDEGLLRWQERAVDLALARPVGASAWGGRDIERGLGDAPTQALLQAMRCGAGEASTSATRAEAAAVLQGWEARPGAAGASWAVSLGPESFSSAYEGREEGGDRGLSLTRVTTAQRGRGWLPVPKLPAASLVVYAAAAVVGALLRSRRE